MKISIVAPTGGTADQWRGFARRAMPDARVDAQTTALEPAARAIEQHAPDLLIVEGTHDGASELATLERIMLACPALAVILVSPNQSAAFLRHGMRIGLREILPAPAAAEDLLGAIERVRERADAAALPRVRGKAYSFIGCKGGSGVTFLAANFAHALAEAGARTALIDLDRQFGDALLHISDRTAAVTLDELVSQSHRLDAALLEASMVAVGPNLHVLPAAEDAEHAMKIRAEHVDALLRLALASYDAVVLDTGRIIDDVTARMLDHSAFVLPVMQVSLPELRDAKRLLLTLGALGFDRSRIRLIVNRHKAGGGVSIAEIASTLRQPVHRTIPNSYAAVTEAINHGVPLERIAPRDPVARGVRELAAEFVDVNDAPSGGWLRSLLGRRAA